MRRKTCILHVCEICFHCGSRNINCKLTSYNFTTIKATTYLQQSPTEKSLVFMHTIVVESKIALKTIAQINVNKHSEHAINIRIMSVTTRNSFNSRNLEVKFCNIKLLKYFFQVNLLLVTRRGRFCDLYYQFRLLSTYLIQNFWKAKTTSFLLR